MQYNSSTVSSKPRNQICCQSLLLHHQFFCIFTDGKSKCCKMPEPFVLPHKGCMFMYLGILIYSKCENEQLAKVLKFALSSKTKIFTTPYYVFQVESNTHLLSSFALFATIWWDNDNFFLAFRRSFLYQLSTSKWLFFFTTTRATS